MADHISLLNLAQQNLKYNTKRQKIVAENVASSRQPGYHTKDLKPFAATISRAQPKMIPLAKTTPGHIAPDIVSQESAMESFEIITTANPFDISPSGNSVSLQDEAMKSAEISAQTKRDTTIASNAFKMLGTAILNRR